MSSWTYVNGTITIDAFGRTQAEKRYILETVLSHLPKVCGSEEDMKVYIIQREGYNVYTSHDEFDVYSGYKSEHDRDIKMQEGYILVLDGSLRDTKFEETFFSLNKFLNRLSKRLHVEDILVSVRGYDREYIFKDRRAYEEMFESPSWVEGVTEPAWWEYLVWDRGVNTPLPMALEYKYYNNPENDKEYERRKTNNDGL